MHALTSDSKCWVQVSSSYQVRHPSSAARAERAKLRGIEQETGHADGAICTAARMLRKNYARAAQVSLRGLRWLKVRIEAAHSRRSPTGSSVASP